LGFSWRERATASAIVVGEYLVDRCARRELAGLDADHLTVDRLGSDPLRLCRGELGAAGGKSGLGLGDVGLGHLADVEPIAALPQLFLQHHHVALVELEDRAGLQDVHVRGRRIQQKIELGQAQGLASGRDLAFGLPRPIGGLKTVVERLCCRNLIRLTDVLIPAAGILVRARFGGRKLIIPPIGDGALDGRPIAGERDPDPFVGRSQGCALRVHLRIVYIGLGKRAQQGIGPRGKRGRKPARRGGNRERKKTAARSALVHPPPTPRHVLNAACHPPLGRISAPPDSTRTNRPRESFGNASSPATSKVATWVSRATLDGGPGRAGLQH